MKNLVAPPLAAAIFGLIFTGIVLAQPQLSQGSARSSVVVSVLSVAAQQAKNFVFRDRKGSAATLIIEAREGGVDIDKSFTATGNVRVQSLLDGLELRGAQANGDLRKEPEPKDSAKSRTIFDNVVISGTVELKIAQVREDKKKGKSTTNATFACDNLLYKRDSKMPNQAITTLNKNIKGNLKTKEEGKEGKEGADTNLIMTAAQGSVRTLIEAKKDEDSLLSGEFWGGVTVDTTQIAPALVKVGDKQETKMKRTRFLAQASRMEFRAKGSNPQGLAELELIDNLKLTSWEEDQDGPEISGATRAILLLNESNDVVGIRLFSSAGSKVKTVVKPEKKGKGNR